ncbi:hypothetical protein KC333_g146 [Hortaea werneckii]|nr:hypothetical protein KC333_g146 [Hortaea werneckii]
MALGGMGCIVFRGTSGASWFTSAALHSTGFPGASRNFINFVVIITCPMLAGSPQVSVTRARLVPGPCTSSCGVWSSLHRNSSLEQEVHPICLDRRPPSRERIAYSNYQPRALQQPSARPAPP